MTDNNGSQDAVVIERTLDAPVDLIWQMWTKPEHFQACYGPMQMWFTGEFREVVVNERLVYTDSMSDEEGNVLSPADMGMPAGHPETTEVIVQLEDLGGSTKMVMTHVGVAADSGGAGGWAMAFDKLEAHVASV